MVLSFCPHLSVRYGAYTFRCVDLSDGLCSVVIEGRSKLGWLIFRDSTSVLQACAVIGADCSFSVLHFARQLYVRLPGLKHDIVN